MVAISCTDLTKSGVSVAPDHPNPSTKIPASTYSWLDYVLVNSPFEYWFCPGWVIRVLDLSITRKGTLNNIERPY